MELASTQGSGPRRGERSRRSRTAPAAALLRAIGNLEHDPDVRNPDWFAVRLLAPSLRLVVRLAPLRVPFLRVVDRVMAGTYHFLTARTRRIDEILLGEIHRGVRQVVILGAGADSRAYRLADELTGVTVFELDHPLTSRWKQSLVRRTLRRLPGNVRYVTVDLGREPLDDALAVTDRAVPVVFVWEGVTPYLDLATIASTLGSVARCAPGSSIVFDYFAVRATAGTGRAERCVRWLGEPWVSDLGPEEIGSVLAAQGLELVSNVAGSELAARHLAGKAVLPPTVGVAHGWVPGTGSPRG